MSDPYEPNSSNAMFGKIMTRLDQQDKMLKSIKAAVDKTNGRVTKLEIWKSVVKAKTAVIASGVSAFVGLCAWLIEHFSSK